MAGVVGMPGIPRLNGMARKPREESPDAIFHVYSRGNYRTAIFDDPGACASFLASVHEVTLRAGWHLYTYAVMPNHFHLMLRTPRANLARGMHLLLSGFGLRFNGIRDERGHVFQGRYNSKRMPAGMAAGRLFDYINLNHVRKGLRKVDELASHELCGVWALCGRSRRGETRLGEALERFVGYPDTPEGWANYNVHLKKVSLEDPAAEIFEADWIHEEIMEATALKKLPGGRAEQSGFTTAELAALEQSHTEDTYDRLLKEVGRTQQQVDRDHGIAPWKLDLAVEMFRLTTVSVPWIVRRLNAGSACHFTRCLRSRARP